MPVPKSKSTRTAQGTTDSLSAKAPVQTEAKAPVQTDSEPTGKKDGHGTSQATTAQATAQATNRVVTASTSTKSADAAAIPQTSDIPASLLPHIDARWFVRPPSGGQYGPATTPMLVDWIAERRITADSFLWREGMESWLSAVEVIPERFGPVPIVPVAAAPGKIAPTSEVANELLREALPGSMASSKAAVTTKKKRQQRQQWIVLGLLVIIALSLAAALIYILWRS